MSLGALSPFPLDPLSNVDNDAPSGHFQNYSQCSYTKNQNPLLGVVAFQGVDAQEANEPAYKLQK